MYKRRLRKPPSPTLSHRHREEIPEPELPHDYQSLEENLFGKKVTLAVFIRNQLILLFEDSPYMLGAQYYKDPTHGEYIRFKMAEMNDREKAHLVHLVGEIKDLPHLPVEGLVFDKIEEDGVMFFGDKAIDIDAEGLKVLAKIPPT